MHTMKVQTKYYRLLKSGQKTIELRLYDEKRRAIKVGDEILFSDLSNASDTFKAEVIDLHRGADFQQLCREIRPENAGFISWEELDRVMVEFYPVIEQQKWGVVGIEIKVIS